MDYGSLGPVSAIVDMTERVPDEVVTVQGDIANGYYAGLSTLRSAVHAWQSGHQQTYVSRVGAFPELHPITLVRVALAQCPDSVPTPGTAELNFITDAPLRQSIRVDIGAANRDLANGEWKGATVLAGAAVEALLLWAIQDHEQHNPGSIVAAGAALFAAHTLANPPHQNPEMWGLHEYVEVTAQLHLIEPETAIQVRQAKNFRNLIHPGRAARLGQTCDRGTAFSALAAVELVCRDLA